MQKVIYIGDYGDHIEVPRATSVHLDLLETKDMTEWYRIRSASGPTCSIHL